MPRQRLPIFDYFPRFTAVVHLVRCEMTHNFTRTLGRFRSRYNGPPKFRNVFVIGLFHGSHFSNFYYFLREFHGHFLLFLVRLHLRCSWFQMGRLLNILGLFLTLMQWTQKRGYTMLEHMNFSRIKKKTNSFVTVLFSQLENSVNTQRGLRESD